MQKQFIVAFLLVVAVLCFGCQQPVAEKPAEAPGTATKAEAAESVESEENESPGCAPDVQALLNHAVVELPGQGQGEIVVVTDPLCWHCRLAHKLLAEMPELYGSLKLLFFPRRGYIGSDMAAWILEDAAGTDRLRKLVDFAYTDLKRVKTDDPIEARMLMLLQFAEAFPDLLQGASLDAAYTRLDEVHSVHVEDGAMFARAADIPGTPVLIAGKAMVVGYGAAQWEKALREMKPCD